MKKIKGFRTLGLNLGAAVIAMFQENIGVHIPPDVGLPALAIANMVMRFFTTTPAGKNSSL